MRNEKMRKLILRRTRSILSALAVTAGGLLGCSFTPSANFGGAGQTPSDTTMAMHYTPSADAISVELSGKARKFNRGLYGAHTGFRVDASDTPEFGIYLPRMGGNMRFTLPKGKLRSTYTPGRMDYEQGGVEVQAQVLRSSDAALWSLTNRTDSEVSIPVRFGGVAEKKFSREGDLGVDPADCFELKDEYCKGNVFTVKGDEVTVEYGTKERKELHLVIPASEYKISKKPVYEGSIILRPGETKYVALFPAGVTTAKAAELPALMDRAEAEREALASTVKISTPESLLNPIGGALAIAADAIWSGEAWLHGSIGWRTPHLGWRGAYAGNAVGRHDRSLTHLLNYADNQITDIPAIYPHPCQDPKANLARAEKKWGTPMYSNGYICRRPGHKDEMSHYDMNLVYADAMLRHFRHTGDTAAMRKLWPTLQRHLAWEKLNFDPDGDHLYDAYCCIWASDALYYDGGQVTHSSAYNKFANQLAAQVAEAIGEDATPYRAEAEAIGRAIDSVLWMSDEGHWAEFKDTMGKKRLHPSAALWTIYHAIDSEVGDPFDRYAAAGYVEAEIPHIPVGRYNGEKYYTVSTTDWKPYAWSINNVAIAEVMHTALALWEAGRSDEAYALMMGCVIDNMYQGASPLNFGQISQYDAARGECYRDFADPIGVWGRALTEGLFGIRPDLLGRKTVEVVPGYPADWKEASISLPDISYQFARSLDENTETYTIENRYPGDTPVELVVRAKGNLEVTIDGRPAEWETETMSFLEPRIRIKVPAAARSEVKVVRKDRGQMNRPTGREERRGKYCKFVEMTNGVQTWWNVIESARENENEKFLKLMASVRNENEKNLTTGASVRNENEKSAIGSDFEEIPSEMVTVDIDSSFNARLNDLFRENYVSPAPASTTLRMPRQGIGEWCHPTDTFAVDNSGLRALAAAAGGEFVTPLGIPLRIPAEGRDIIFTSLWDNYPDSVTVPLSGSGTRLYAALAGSCNHMQHKMEAGRITVRYTDGTSTVYPLVSPFTWAPIEQDFYTDDYAYTNHGIPQPMRLHLKTGLTSRRLTDHIEGSGVYGRQIEGGAGVMAEIALDPSKQLSSLTLETLSNDVIIGLMALTIGK